MKDRPILFNGEMVRAVLEGRKTQTRRICKLRDVDGKDLCAYSIDAMKALLRQCPYGQPGDRLWVRETWRQTESGSLYYRSDDDYNHDCKWKPSIHMPRWASRILLEITDICVERIQDISEEDAKAEGVSTSNLPTKTFEGWADRFHTGLFQYLWDSINLACGYGWNSNPYVWVVKFKEVKQ